MLEDLRDDADFVDEGDELGYEDHESADAASAQSQILGMSPQQRFVIAIMLLMMVCILGSFFLLITGSVAIPV